MKQTVCIYLYLTYHMNEKQNGATPQPYNLNPSNLELPYKQKIKWPSEPNEQNIEHPITSLIFVKSKSVIVPLPMFSGSRKPILTFILQLKNPFLKKWLHCNKFAGVRLLFVYNVPMHKTSLFPVCII